MTVDTRTMPGKLTRGRDGEQVASGWVLISYEMVGDRKPLPEWRGEMTVTGDERAALGDERDGLYLHLSPYGGVFEPWHGPVSIELVPPDLDPAQRRVRLTSAGTMTRSLYHQEGEGEPEHTLMLDDSTAEQA